MVDCLTYLCFVFLNDRSDAWWEMQWAACQGGDNSQERACRSCVQSQFTRISAVFKVSLSFFSRYYWLLREQLFSSLPPSPNYHSQDWQTGRAGRNTTCMGRSNSGKKLMCCINAKMWLSWGHVEEIQGREHQKTGQRISAWTRVHLESSSFFIYDYIFIGILYPTSNYIDNKMNNNQYIWHWNIHFNDHFEQQTDGVVLLHTDPHTNTQPQP